MKRFILLFSILVSIQLKGSAQSDTASYGVVKNMPVFFEQLKQQLNYPEAWGNTATKNFDVWKTEARKVLMECMQNLPPAPKEYNI